MRRQILILTAITLLAGCDILIEVKEKEEELYEPTAQEAADTIEYQAEFFDQVWGVWSWAIESNDLGSPVANTEVGDDNLVTFTNYELDEDVDTNVDYIFSGTFQAVQDEVTEEVALIIHMEFNVIGLATGTIDGTGMIIEDEGNDRTYIEYDLIIGGIAATSLAMKTDLELTYWDEAIIYSEVLINGYDFTTEYNTFYDTF